MKTKTKRITIGFVTPLLCFYISLQYPIIDIDQNIDSIRTLRDGGAQLKPKSGL